ncbi:DHH family phosphoesterase (plasmid) [Ahniella affigens]|uniref:Single-stranded-DNA-specific exonuclease RecJ n=1 Tax=Ahniella affigens TaxID=2021234 RepID=A0A2P1PZJ7_9GAMM|nr:DHHA1 domain-containing protein [Ahniella affigens]AVQ00269.1 DHH family phosphoesterase [Ahniella affigens]
MAANPNNVQPPSPAIRLRSRDSQVEALAQEEGFSRFQAALIAGRVGIKEVAAAGSVERLVRPSLSQLERPTGMPDIRQAAERIAKAIHQGELIAIASDHDADGVTGQCVVWSFLVRVFGVPAHNVMPLTTHRLQEGYGVSRHFVARLLGAERIPSLLITVDQGTSDEAQIQQLRNAGVDVIVSDHHGCPAAGPPGSAVATVNPTRADSRYDPTVAGCYVAWLLMTQVASLLREAGWPLSQGEDAKSLLDFVALGTTVDCVSLASVNNRAVVRAGLRQIAAAPRQAWRAFSEVIQPDPGRRSPWLSSDLSFMVGPRINARGRVDEAMAGVHALLSESAESARHWVSELDTANQERKAIEAELNAVAFVQANQLSKLHRVGFVIVLEQGHVGVHGITASRVVEAFGRPTICCSPRPDDPLLLSGSCRSVPGVDIKNLLDTIQERHSCLVKHGGHPGAAGLTLERTRLAEFADAFNAEVARRQAWPGVELGPVVWVDGPWPRSMTLRSELVDLEPFGRGFPAPIFQGDYAIDKVKEMGDGTHLRLSLSDARGAQGAVWFGARTKDDVKHGRLAVPSAGRVLAKPLFGRYAGMDRCEMQVVRLMPSAAHL